MQVVIMSGLPSGNGEKFLNYEPRYGCSKMGKNIRESYSNVGFFFYSFLKYRQSG